MDMLIENSNFLIQEIPELNPITDRYEYLDWWKDVKRKCIEGFWVGGKWMSGPGYFYHNMYTIEFESEDSIAQTYGRPWLRDIDWESEYIYEEARGFSGFSGLTNITADRRYGPDKERALMLKEITEEDLKGITYIPARKLLRLIDKDYGKPLYKNRAQNVMSMQSRGGGKSYWASGIAAHNLLFGGATNYDRYLEQLRKKSPFTSDTVIGAVSTQYTVPLMQKLKTGLERLPGGMSIGGVEYPSPLYLSLSGTWLKDTETALGSKLRHRTFQDSALTANGTRPNLAIIDEIGFLHNVIEVMGALEQTQASQAKKYMTIYALGTGGLVGGKAAVYAEEIFRNPEKYNCLVFDDIWENRGKIGHFVPGTMTMNKHKRGPNKETDLVTAELEIKLDREKKKVGSNLRSYYIEVINKPLVPSEMFLSVEGGYFPSFALKERLGELETNPERWYDTTWKGDLIFEADGDLKFESKQHYHPIREYPLGQGADKLGCLEIFEHPVKEMGTVPFGRYIGGMDTVDKAASTTDSLFSVFIFDRYTRRIIAEYTGRNPNPKTNYEIARRMLIYYNALGMYEQSWTGIYTHFEAMHSMHYLADTPVQLRNPSTFKDGTNTSKGISPNKKVNSDGRRFILAWMEERLDSKNPDYTPIQEIRSPALLQELIKWNKDGNFDRVSALIMLMWLDETMFKFEEKEQQKASEIADSDYFLKELGLGRSKTSENLSNFADIDISKLNKYGPSNTY